MEDITQKPKLNNLSLSLIDEKIDLRTLYYSLLAGKWYVLSTIVICVIIGILYALIIPPKYESSLLLQVENKQAGMNVGFSNSSFLKQTASPADINITLIKSRFILVPVVESLGLDFSVRPHVFPIGKTLFSHFYSDKYVKNNEYIEVPTFKIYPDNFEGEFVLIASKNNSYKLFTATGKQILSGQVGQQAEAINDKMTISMLVKTLDAHPGAEFFINKRSAINIADKIVSAVEISDLGQSYQLDKTGVLEMSLRGTNPQYVADVLNKIALIAIKKDTERKLMEATTTLKFLNEQLPGARASLNAAEEALNQHKMTSGTIDFNIRSRMILKQLAEVQQEIEKTNLTKIMLLQTLTPLHPSIIMLNYRKEALEKELASLEKQLQTLPAADQVAVSLMRDIKVRNQLYIMLLNKIQENKFLKASTLSDLRVLHSAQPPNSALPSGRVLIILASIILGFILGSFIVMIRKVFKRYIEDPNWLEQHFGIPTFAIIPYSRIQKTHVQSNTEQKQGIPILAHTQPRDLSIEALRSLRTSLQFALIGAKNNIISIMGISPGIGKSFISVNFAHILAESGKKVLLIDGDIRKGYLYQYFNTHKEPGLSEVISGQCSIKEAIQKTNLASLDFMTTGKFPPNPSEILLSSYFKEMLSAISTQYDLVVIDTAPVLAVTDGTIIGNLSGVNFLVIAGATHQAEEIELAVKRLHSNNVVVQGAIYNNINPMSQTQNRYNYQYQYGEDEKADA